jgi:chitodextrinase
MYSRGVIGMVQFVWTNANASVTYDASNNESTFYWTQPPAYYRPNTSMTFSVYRQTGSSYNGITNLGTYIHSPNQEMSKTVSGDLGGLNNLAIRWSNSIDNSNYVSLTPPDNTPPDTPYFTDYYRSGVASSYIEWNQNSDVTQYEVYANDSLLALTYNNNYTHSTTNTNTYTVRGRDAAGNWSEFSSGVTVYGDETPPDTPTITSASVSGSTIALQWTSNPDVYRYELYRDDASIGLFMGNSPTFADMPDGTYTYTVRARDLIGNWSDFSNTVKVTVDTTAPPPPTTPPTVSQQDLNKKEVELEWPPEPSAASYVIYRDEVQVGTSTTPTYKDEVPVDGTYTYTFTSVDDSGNESPPSSPVTVTVKTCVKRTNLHAPEAIKTGTVDQLDYTLGQRIFEGQNNVRFNRPPMDECA